MSFYKEKFPPRSNVEPSLLTAPLPPEVEAEMRRKEEQVDRARILVLEIWLQAYKSGDLTLDKLCMKSRQALKRVGEGHRQRALGQMLDAALGAYERGEVPPRPRGNKGEPPQLRDLARGMVTIANEEYGHPLNRAGNDKPSAFERVAEILTDLGVGGLTPRQIEQWHYEPPK